MTARLQHGTQGPLTLVSAPAGTGKTAAVAAWAVTGKVAGSTVWVSLDESDLASPALWAIIVEGLRRHGVDATRRAPTAGLNARDRTFLSALAGAIVAHPEPITLVLDCDGALAKEDAAGLDYLLRRAGDRLRLVLLTRADPLLPIHRYRLDGSLSEIRLADLAFTPVEAAGLLAAKGVDLPPATTDFVAERTRGWAAGLLLAAMSLVHRPDPDEAARDFTGDTGAVAEYLLAEVLDTQPPAARELLLATSVVDVLRPGLVEALAGASAPRALTFLAHGNAFLEELPGSTGCYRYHPLFRDLLRAQLAFESAERAHELHQRAAEWFFENDLLTEAVRHALSAGEPELAAGYVVDNLAVGQLLTQHPAGPLADALARLPRSATGVSVSLVRGAQALARLDAEDCHHELAAARRRLTQDETATVQLALALLDMVLARLTSDAAGALGAAAEVERLMAHQAPDLVESHPEVAALVAANRGAALVLAGRLAEASDAFATGIELAPSASRERPTIDCLGHLALIAAWEGRLRRAVELAERAVELQVEAGLTQASCPSAAQTALAWAHSDMYDRTRARQHLLRAAQSVPSPADPLQAVMLAIVGARLYRFARDVAGARAALSDVPRATLPPWLVDRLRVEEAVLDIHAGEHQRALDDMADLEGQVPEAALVAAEARLAHGEELARPVPAPDGSRPLATRVDRWLIEAWRRVRRGEEPAAARALERSLRLAEPERLRRPFREAPRDVRLLLRRYDDPARQHSWLGPELAGPPAVPLQRRRPAVPAGASEPVLVVEPLTDKEREVLGHLAELLTTDEIAIEMFVSVNTVRTHVRNILRKMSASRRNEAVRRARDLGIIPAAPSGPDASASG